MKNEVTKMKHEMPKNLEGVFTDGALLQMMLWGDDHVANAPNVYLDASPNDGVGCTGNGLTGLILDRVLSAEYPLKAFAAEAAELRKVAAFLEETGERGDDFVYAARTALSGVDQASAARYFAGRSSSAA